MVDLTQVLDPLEYPHLYRKVVNPRTGETVYKIKKSRRAVKIGIQPADARLLYDLVKKHKMPLPGEFSATPRATARAAKATFYWSPEGCKRHGYPMLRRSSTGTCIACEDDRKDANRAWTAKHKQLSRKTQSELASTPAAAQNQGDKTYWTGVRCSHGHLAERYASTGECVHCVYERMGKHYIPPLIGRSD